MPTLPVLGILKHGTDKLKANLDNTVRLVSKNSKVNK